jgi:uncharacterized protein (DUF736 family)
MTKSIKNNTAVLFPIDRNSDKSPSFIGKGIIRGSEWRVALWKNTASNGETYLRLDFDEPWVYSECEDQGQEMGHKGMNSLTKHYG